MSTYTPKPGEIPRQWLVIDANDVVLGLINLGYKQVEAQKAVKKILDETASGTSPDQGQVLRAALRLLSQA